jgi:sulfate permease, SulP family
MAGLLVRYRRDWLRWDLLAGLTTAAVVIPQAVAYASLAGLPVEVGLYVAIVPMVAYALVGSSRPLSVSSTSTISILTAGALVEAGADGDPGRAVATASLLALLVGGFLAAAGLLRLGFLADFISSPVLAGFKAGMGLYIAASQLGKVLGVPVEGDSFFAKVWSALGQLGDANPATVALALGGLAALLALHRWAPKVPGPLVVVVLGIALVASTDLEGRGVALVGPVNGGLPTFALPDLDGVGRLLPAAAGIALMSFIESISAARAFAARTDPPVDADRELLALGAANLAGGLFQAYPAGGGTSQTAVNDGAGARTQVAELVTAAMAVLTLTLLASLLADLAQPILGAIVLVAAIGLVNLAPLRRIRSVRQRDFWLGLVALGGVLTFGVLRGVLVAVLISLLVLLHELDHPHIVAGQSAPGLLVVRPEGRLFFANARRVVDQIGAIVVDQQPPPRVVLLDLTVVPDLEITALDRLADLAEDLHGQGMILWAAAPSQRPLEMLRRAAELLGRTDLQSDTGRLGVRLFPTIDEAISAHRDRPQPDRPPGLTTRLRAAQGSGASIQACSSRAKSSFWVARISRTNDLAQWSQQVLADS